MSRLISRACVAAGALTLLTACGTTEDPVPEAEDADAAGEAVSVTDSRGETIELDAPAETVVALEWAEAEMAVSLGVMPVGVAQAEDYGIWNTAAPLDDDVTDVGNRQEPSVDSIVALEPDVIITGAERGDPVIEQLEEHVPVVVTQASDASSPEANLERMREDFQLVAEVLGKTDEAEQQLAEFDDALEEGRQQIADAGAEGSEFVMADGWEDGGAIAIRPFGQGSYPSAIAIEMGLVNAWEGEVDERWGLGQTDVEGLTTIEGEDVHFMYNASDGNDLFAEGLAGNDIWESLEFVESDRVYRMTDGIWTFGGPASGEQLIDEFVRVFTE